LDFHIVVPGHGRPFTDRGRIRNLQSLLSDLWKRTEQACGQGISTALAAKQIDISDHSAAYSTLTGPGVPIAAVERMYELMGCEP